MVPPHSSRFRRGAPRNSPLHVPWRAGAVPRSGRSPGLPVGCLVFVGDGGRLVQPSPLGMRPIAQRVAGQRGTEGLLTVLSRELTMVLDSVRRSHSSELAHRFRGRFTTLWPVSRTPL